MRDYAELDRDARDVMPFSNSTEGDGWMGNWCDLCVHDKPARTGDYRNGCPLILVAMSNKTPLEWLDGPRDERGNYSTANQYHCIEFRSESDGPPPPTEPEPTPPGQGELFPMDTYVGPRMFADVVSSTQAFAQPVDA